MERNEFLFRRRDDLVPNVECVGTKRAALKRFRLVRLAWSSIYNVLKWGRAGMMGARQAAHPEHARQSRALPTARTYPSVDRQ